MVNWVDTFVAGYGALCAVTALIALACGRDNKGYWFDNTTALFWFCFLQAIVCLLVLTTPLVEWILEMF